MARLLKFFELKQILWQIVNVTKTVKKVVKRSIVPVTTKGKQAIGSYLTIHPKVSALPEIPQMAKISVPMFGIKMLTTPMYVEKMNDLV